MTITTTHRAWTSDGGGNCAHKGCTNAIRWTLTATDDSNVSAVTFSCNAHLRHQELHSVRMVADALEARIAERQAA